MDNIVLCTGLNNARVMLNMSDMKKCKFGRKIECFVYSEAKLVILTSINNMNRVKLLLELYDFPKNGMIDFWEMKTISYPIFAKHVQIFFALFLSSIPPSFAVYRY
jgi:hypothetical protein